MVLLASKFCAFSCSKVALILPCYNIQIFLWLVYQGTLFPILQYCFSQVTTTGIDLSQAESLTGIEDPILAGQQLLKEGIRTKWVIIKMGPRGSILITPSSISCAPAFKVVKCECATFMLSYFKLQYWQISKLENNAHI